MILGGVSLAFGATCASANANDDLLSCNLQIDSLVRYDDPFHIIAQLEVKKPCCIYYPLSWGYVWGLRLFLSDAGGNVTEPEFHPNFEHSGPGMMARKESYRCLRTGEIASLADKAQASRIFPARGQFKVQLGYVPEPSRMACVPLPDTVVMEDGSLLSSWYSVNVI